MQTVLRALCLLPLLVVSAFAADRTNIVLIMADENDDSLRHCYGNASEVTAFAMECGI